MNKTKGANAVSLPDQSDGGPSKVIMIYDTFEAVNLSRTVLGRV